MTKEGRYNDDSRETRWPNWGFLLSAAIGLMVLIGIVFERCVQPNEAVWNEVDPVHWNVPLPLTIDTEIEDYREALELMVRQVNRQVGCDILRVADNPRIRIVQGTIEVGAETVDWAAGSFVSSDGTRAEIVVYRPLMVGTDLWVLMHETGHILGLAHDGHRIMKPIIKESIGGPLRVARFTDKDASALEDRYCR